MPTLSFIKLKPNEQRSPISSVNADPTDPNFVWLWQHSDNLPTTSTWLPTWTDARQTRCCKSEAFCRNDRRAFTHSVDMCGLGSCAQSIRGDVQEPEMFFFVLVCWLSVYLYHLLLYIFHTIYYDIRTWPDCTLVLVPVPHASQWVTTGWPVAVAAPVKQEQRRRALQKGTEDEWCFHFMLTYFHFLSSGSKILRKLETVGMFWLATFFCNPYKWLTVVWYSLVSPLDSWSSIPTEHHPILFSSELPWPWQNLTVISVQIKKDRELESSFPS